MDAMYQVCKYCKHAKPTLTDLLYCEIWKQKVCEHERCDGESENYFEEVKPPSGINRQIMTVQELIDELSKVEDKTMEVNFPYSHGTQENGDPLNVNEVSVYDDCVIIYN